MDALSIAMSNKGSCMSTEYQRASSIDCHRFPTNSKD